MRAASITLVLFGHFVLPASEAGIGAVGVTVFFFISGFLITRLLFLEFRHTGSISWRRFYARRFARLYPALLLYLGVLSAVQWQRTGTTSLLELASALGYFSNYLVSWRNSHGTPFLLPIGGLWSLAIEEHFYILMPLAALILRMRPASILWAAASVCGGCLLVRTAEMLIWPQFAGALVIYRDSETRFDSIAIGVLMAALAEREGGRRFLQRMTPAGWLAGGGAVFGASYLIQNEFARQVLRYSIQQAALLPVFCGILFGRATVLQRVLNLAAVRLVGRLSYSLYIWQGGTKYLVAGWTGRMPWLDTPPALLAITFAAAAASYYLAERPVMTLCGRLQRPVTSAPHPGAGSAIWR